MHLNNQISISRIRRRRAQHSAHTEDRKAGEGGVQGVQEDAGGQVRHALRGDEDARQAVEEAVLAQPLEDGVFLDHHDCCCVCLESSLQDGACVAGDLLACRALMSTL